MYPAPHKNNVVPRKVRCFMPVQLLAVFPSTYRIFFSIQQRQREC